MVTKTNIISCCYKSSNCGKINYKIKFPLRYVPKIAENIKHSQEILEFYKGYKAKTKLQNNRLWISKSIFTYGERDGVEQ